VPRLRAIPARPSPPVAAVNSPHWTQPRALLVRDRTTIFLYALLAVWGYFNYGFGPMVALLRDEQQISRGLASLHGTAFAAGAVVGGTLTPWLVRRYGRATSMWWSVGGLGVTILGLCAVRPLPLTLGFAFGVAIAGTTLLSGIVSGLSDHQRAAAPAAISEANAAACASGAAAPIVIGATVAAGWTWRPAVAVVVALFALLAVLAWFWRVRLPDGAAAPAAIAPGDAVGPGGTGVPARSAAHRGGRLPKAYWLAFTVMSLCGSVEVSVNLWAADLLRAQAGLSPANAAAAISAVVAGMFIGRVGGGRLALRYSPTGLLLVALAVSAIGFGVFWVATAPVLGLVGLVVAGLGNGLHFPLAISLALQASDGRPDLATARAAYSLAIAFGLAPFLLGALADATSVRSAFLMVPVLLVAAALVVLRIRRGSMDGPRRLEPPVDLGVVRGGGRLLGIPSGGLS